MLQYFYHVRFFQKEPRLSAGFFGKAREKRSFCEDYAFNRGHWRRAFTASAAVEQYIRDNTGYEVVTVDFLKAINRFLDKTVCDSYRFMAKRVPAVFGRLYKQTNPGKTCSLGWCPSSAAPSATCCTPPLPAISPMSS